MDELLLELLETLDEIGRSHEEIYDTVCRDEMGDAVFHGFIKPSPGYKLPEDFGLSADEANQRVRAALSRYVESASELAARLGLADFHGVWRLFRTEMSELPVGGSISIPSLVGRIPHVSTIRETWWN